MPPDLAKLLPVVAPPFSRPRRRLVRRRPHSSGPPSLSPSSSKKKGKWGGVAARAMPSETEEGAAGAGAGAGGGYRRSGSSMGSSSRSRSSNDGNDNHVRTPAKIPPPPLPSSHDQPAKPEATASASSTSSNHTLATAPSSGSHTHGQRHHHRHHHRHRHHRHPTLLAHPPSAPTPKRREEGCGASLLEVQDKGQGRSNADDDEEEESEAGGSGNSSSSSRSRNNSNGSAAAASASAFWEAEGDNSHELSQDELDDARRRVSSLFAAARSDSDLSPTAEAGDPVPQFAFHELSLGKFLGRGGFSNVHEIRSIRLHSDHHDSSPGLHRASSTELSARQFLAEHCTRPSGEARYALKQVRVHQRSSHGGGSGDDYGGGDAEDGLDNAERQKRTLVGRIDLATEAEFLRRLQHPNVVKLRGTAMGDPFAPGYFLVVDRLCDTLYSRMLSWKDQSRKMRRSGSSVSRLVGTLLRRCSFRGGSGSGSDHNNNDDDEALASAPPARTVAAVATAGTADPHDRFWVTRLSAAYDLASAVEYLHENRIIHRDIKPTNIGFDIRGDLKIFDFGMARVLDPREASSEDGTHANLSHMTGSLRYMAPEVAMGRPYHTSCDVYSLSLVVWEMLALKRPYRSSVCKDEAAFKQKVFEGRARPPLPSHWPSTVREVLSGGWAHDLADRLDVGKVCAGLLSELARRRDPHQHQQPREPGQVIGGVGADHRCRRRSTYVYKPAANASESAPSKDSF